MVRTPNISLDAPIVLGFAVLVIALLLPAVGAKATDVAAGYDLFETPLNGAILDFGDTSPSVPGNLPPIPADFFYPGTPPFTGLVNLVGQPFGTFLAQPTGDADTIVERLSNATLPTIPSSDTIPIEIVALSLRSIASLSPPPNPGGVWALNVSLSSTAPSTGTMTIHHTSLDGGTFDWTINLCPEFTFVDFTPPFGAVTLDYCVAIDPGGLPLTVTGQPWAHVSDLALISPLSGPDFFPAGTVFPVGIPNEMEPIEVATAPPAVPPVHSLGAVGLIAAATLLLVASARDSRRQQKNRAEGPHGA